MPELAILPMDDSVRGRELVFRYETAFYYDPVLTETPEGWRLTLERKPFPAPVTRQFTDTLLAPWLEEPRVFAARAEGRDLGYLELSHETWNNRMRISNLWVAEDCRRQGIGAALMARAEAEARRAGARALVLETQSCNHPAISFYRRQGFALTGLDLTAYSQADRENREVRLEFARPAPFEKETGTPCPAIASDASMKRYSGSCPPSSAR